MNRTHEQSIAENVEDGTIYYVWNRESLCVMLCTDGYGVSETISLYGHDAKRMIRQWGLNREINRRNRTERRRKRRKEQERRNRLKNGGDNNA